MDTELFIKLYQYNDWANAQLMDIAAVLDDTDYRRDFGQAWGSVHGTLAHLLDAESIWWARWHGESPQGTPDGAAFADLAALRARWQPFQQERLAWLGGLSADDLNRPLAYKNTKGTPFTQPLWWQLYHVINHGTDHRGYLSVMLTELGHAPSPLDFIAYVRLEQ